MKKRLVFIAHSLGGLVCANILVKKSGQSHYSDFVDIASRCVEIVFLATPFCGNDPDAWKVIIHKLCPTAQVEANDNSGAIQVQCTFQTLLANRFSLPPFRVENLVEAGDEEMSNVVVTADSSELNSAIPVEINADHESISKCADRRGLAFEHILTSLQMIEERALKRYPIAAHHGIFNISNNVTLGASNIAHLGDFSGFLLSSSSHQNLGNEAKPSKDSDKDLNPAV